MASKTAVVVCLLVCLLIFTLPFAIASIVLGTKEGQCDNTDIMGLNVADYLLGSGIASLVTILLLVATAIGAINKSAVCGVLGIVSIVLSGLFSIAWTVVGGVILFRSNLDCIHSSYPYVCYAVFMWCWTVWSMCSNSSSSGSYIDV